MPGKSLLNACTTLVKTTGLLARGAVGLMPYCVSGLDKTMAVMDHTKTVLDLDSKLLDPR